jgi:hypothetical protein
MSSDDLHDLEITLHSRLPLVVIETREENRLLELFARLGEGRDLRIQTWSVTRGLTRLGATGGPRRDLAEPEAMLRHILAVRNLPGIFLLLDFHPYLDDPLHVRLLREIALAHGELGHTVVLVGHRLEIPPELEHHSARFSLHLPGRKELAALVGRIASEWAAAHGGKVRGDRESFQHLVDTLRGLPLVDARCLAHKAIFDDGAITPDDLPRVMQAKYELLNRGGALSFEYDTARFAEVGGLANIKRWLEQRKPAFRGAIPGLDRPRGILIMGVQGGGKSLAARAVAGSWGVPLLRLDFGTLFNKYHGETERNLRLALQSAQAMAPCVLWIDEIEKAISGGDHDGGTSRRLLGNLLTWMADNQSGVFIVATANEIEALPPELVRKGRLDEIFFVDLPRAETRAEIFAIHLRKRGLALNGFDLRALAEASEGFSGAEIEQAVVSALYGAHAQGRQPDQAMIREELRRTRPLSVVMAERLDRLRGWARGRTVAAD